MSFEKTVYDTIRSEGLPANMANLITAQSKHESANYTSNVFLKSNNLFGYKYVGQSLATRGLKSPEGDYYAAYKTVSDSARELARWVKRRAAEGKFPADLTTIQTPAEYAALLKRAGYYGDNLATYTAGLQRFFKDYGSAAAISSAAVIAIGAAAFLFLNKA